MELLKPYFIIEDEVNGAEILKRIERYGRVCWKSEGRIGPDSAPKFVRGIMKKGHESVIEHEKVTVRIVCDRGVSHEIVRHRIASYSQESTRYCDYSDDPECTPKGVKFIEPFFFMGNPEKLSIWMDAMMACEKAYNALIALGATPQEARSVLPNSLKTEIIVTFNLREWRHFFGLRCAKAAHPQMREITIPLFKELKSKIPVIFDDIAIAE